MIVHVTLNGTTQAASDEDLKRFSPTAYGIACQMQPGSRRVIRGGLGRRDLIVIERRS